MPQILPPDATGIRKAAALLRDGHLVAFGTETVYGLGADATNDRAVAAIFEATGRPRFNPLICHYPEARAAFAHVEATDLAHRLAQAFWPGPLTLILNRRPDCPVSLLAAAGLPTLAVRVPAVASARILLAAAGLPVAAPSANPSGRISPTTAAHVLEGLGERIAAVLDSGPCAVGLESTVLDLSGPSPALLRPGGLAAEAIEAITGPLARTAAPEGPILSPIRSPGQLSAHYAPSVPLRLDAAEAAPDEALLAFGPAPPGAGALFQLSERRDLTEAAARLFQGLHTLDAACRDQGLTRIAAMKIPDTDLGRAINDRLQRAAKAYN
jgi:L-threonylcarbamoyladenylate synthase